MSSDSSNSSSNSSSSSTAEASGSKAPKKEKKAHERVDFVNTTPAGEKKDFSSPMLPEYHPQAVEAAHDAWWTAQGFFKASAPAAISAGESARFSMVIPPPNVTGSLHLGHALTGAIEDCLTRWHRMCGRPTLWLPGTDHAGIATQAVVEKRLAKLSPPVTRHELGREAFLAEVWKWKEQYGSRIYEQMRHLGVSVDWSRSAFTMDEKLSAAVTEAFVRMHAKGLIYRDTRLVNWCCELRTAISDEEVDKVEIEKKVRRAVPGHDASKTYEFGVLTSFAYKLVPLAEGEESKFPPPAVIDPPPTAAAANTATGSENSSSATSAGATPTSATPATPATGKESSKSGGGSAAPVQTWVVTPGEEIIVATTRPETMLGDTAVAVHPDDKRYAHLVGRKLTHPFIPDRVITIIADKMVDPAFGSGAVKITPAHDANDFECGKRHGLPFISVFDENGRISSAGGARFQGLMRFDAREAVVKALQEAGLYRGKADNKMVLPICSRSGDVIEPLIKPQWYVRCAEMGKAAADAVRSGELKLVPDIHNPVWFSWLDNIRDWCISRQLWWGHRIPAFFILVAGRSEGSRASMENWAIARTEAEAKAIAAARFGVPEGDITLQQDEDVLDTWFSSGLFPFATLGWPNEEHPDFKAFYPNTVLETGHDILFFWVSRMVMLGQTLTGKLPFKTVYLHAMVRDKHGRKMSKSLGNVIDPMEVIYGCDLETLLEKVRSGNLPEKEILKALEGQKLEFPKGIPECGADGLRFGLLGYTVQGRDINLDLQRVVAYRQFCNKLWNAVRFAMDHLAPAKYTPVPLLDALDELATSPHLALRDRWILSRLNNAVATCTNALSEYSFSGATTAAYDFWLYEFCDYYLELVKPLLSRGDSASAASAGGNVAAAQRLARLCIAVSLDFGLKLLHPFMPFVTEELWQRLPGRGGPSRADGSVPDPASIMIAPWPVPISALQNAGVEKGFDLFKEVLTAGRRLRGEADIPPSKAAASAVFHIVADEANSAILKNHERDLLTLLPALEIHYHSTIAALPEGCSAAMIEGSVSVHLLLKGLVDPETEIKKIGKKIADVQKDLAKVEKKQKSEGYKERSPPEVQAEDNEAIARANSQLAALAALAKQYESWKTA